MRIGGWVLVTCHIRFSQNENQQRKLKEKEEKDFDFRHCDKMCIFVPIICWQQVHFNSDLIEKCMRKCLAGIWGGVIQELLFALFNASIHRTQAFKTQI